MQNMTITVEFNILEREAKLEAIKKDKIAQRETDIFRGKDRDVDRYNQQNDAYTWQERGRVQG